MDSGSAAYFAEVTRRLQEQDAALNSMRGRAGSLLSASLVVAGLAIASLPHHLAGHRLTAAIAALGILAAMCVLVVLIQWPRGWAMGGTLDKVREALTGPHGPEYTAEDIHMSLVHGAHDSLELNRATLRTLNMLLAACYGLSVVALVLAAIAMG